MRKPKLVVLLALVAAVGVLSYETVVRAGAPIDLNGDWTVTTEGGVSITCTASVEQTGTSLQAALSCPGVRDTPLYGEVNPQTRELSLDLDGEQGLDIELHGTVSADGNRVDGTWEWSGGDLSGTFQASRGLEPQPVPDLSGTWIVETGRTLESCQATVEQTGVDVQLDVLCPGVRARRSRDRSTVRP